MKLPPLIWVVAVPVGWIPVLVFLHWRNFDSRDGKCFICKSQAEVVLLIRGKSALCLRTLSKVWLTYVYWRMISLRQWCLSFNVLRTIVRHACNDYHNRKKTKSCGVHYHQASHYILCADVSRAEQHHVKVRIGPAGHSSGITDLEKQCLCSYTRSCDQL